MTSVLLSQLDQIERAYNLGQLTYKEANNLVREIDIMLDAKELEL